MASEVPQTTTTVVHSHHNWRRAIPTLIIGAAGILLGGLLAFNSIRSDHPLEALIGIGMGLSMLRVLHIYSVVEFKVVRENNEAVNQLNAAINHCLKMHFPPYRV